MKLDRIALLSALAISIISFCFAASAHLATITPSESVTTGRVICEIPAATKRSISVAPDKLVFAYTAKDGSSRCVFMLAEDAEKLVQIARQVE